MAGTTQAGARSGIGKIPDRFAGKAVARSKHALALRRTRKHGLWFRLIARAAAAHGWQFARSRGQTWGALTGRMG